MAIDNVSWCPRKDLNLQPLVCRTSAPSVELLGRSISFELRVSSFELRTRAPEKLETRNPKLNVVVGVGIEPTFRVFQTRANPSQLSDRGLVLGLWTLVFGPGLADPDFLQRPKIKDLRPSFAMHLLHDVTIIVYVHEEVLTPLGSCFCIVTKHYTFELHT